MPKARRMLSDWNAPYIQALARLIETQSKATLANWALDYAQSAVLPLWSARRPDDSRPRDALAAARTIGQCAATIHSARHCIGLALYGALAVAYDDLGTKAPWAQLEQRAAEECGRMLAALRAVAVEDEPNPAKINWNC